MIFAKVDILPDGGQEVTVWRVDEESMVPIIEALMDPPLCVNHLTPEQVVSCRDAIDLYPSVPDGLDYPAER